MKKLSTLRAGILISIAFAPVLTFAQGVNDVARGIGTFAGLVDGVTQTVVKSVASLLLALALLAFFYGIVEYIWAKRKGDTKGVTDGNKFMTGGLIALFVMFSVYGIIKFAQNTIFGNADMTSISIPNINFGGGKSPSVSPAPGGVTSPGSGTGAATGSVSSCIDGYVSNGKCYNDVCQGGCLYTGPSTGGVTGPGSGTGAATGGATGAGSGTGAGTGSSGLGEGVGCTTTSQCASGLTCSGGVYDKQCTAGGSVGSNPNCGAYSNQSSCNSSGCYWNPGENPPCMSLD